MFREFKQVKQERGGGRRRWFESDDLDLVVWYDAGGKVTGFQLCYDFGDGERAVTWRETGGYSHDRIDAGDDTPLKNQTPVLIPDGAVPWTKLLQAFEPQCASLDSSLQSLIRQKLQRAAR